jgi:hypothetical protein
LKPTAACHTNASSKKNTGITGRTFTSGSKILYASGNVAINRLSGIKNRPPSRAKMNFTTSKKPFFFLKIFYPRVYKIGLFMAIANHKISNEQSVTFKNLLKIFQVSALSLMLCICTLAFSTPAWANVQIKLTNVIYEPCTGDAGKNMVLGGGVMSAKCYMIKGEANNTSGKVVYNADIFGRIYDANGNDAMPERARLGAVEEIPTGTSNFQIMVAVPAEQPEPLELKQFKASGFAGKVRR